MKLFRNKGRITRFRVNLQDDVWIVSHPGKIAVIHAVPDPMQGILGAVSDGDIVVMERPPLVIDDPIGWICSDHHATSIPRFSNEAGCPKCMPVIPAPNIKNPL